MRSKLKYWLKPIDKIFADFDGYVLDVDNVEKHRIYIDRNSDVLFVAHLDTILPPKFTQRRKKGKIFAQGLDDRLGCLAACELSEELGADLLLTDHEESFCTTAEYHKCKNYNWIAEFDRTGNDVVTYGLDCEEFTTALTKYWKLGCGSYSDICSLETDICCVNIGIGYEHAHHKNSYFDIKTYREQMGLFRKFYRENCDKQFMQEYQEKLWDRYAQQDYYFKCDICGSPEVEHIFDYAFCVNCVEDIMSGIIIIDK